MNLKSSYDYTKDQINQCRIMLDDMGLNELDVQNPMDSIRKKIKLEEE